MFEIQPIKPQSPSWPLTHAFTGAGEVVLLAEPTVGTPLITGIEWSSDVEGLVLEILDA